MKASKIISKTYILIILVPLLEACQEAQILSPEPTALQLDHSAPECPGLTAVTVSAGPTLTVEWAEATDAVSESSKLTYSIFMREGSNNYDLVSPSKIVIGATTTLISDGLSLGKTYTLFVTCKDEAGNAEPSGPKNELSVTVHDISSPSKVLGLSVSALSESVLSLTWSPSDDGDGGTTASNMRYRVYAATSAGVSTLGSPLVTVAGGATSYNHVELNPNTTQYYKVVALDEVGNLSETSSEASGTTLDDTAAPVFSPNSGIQVTSSGTTTIDIGNVSTPGWNIAADNVPSTQYPQYRLYRCSESTTCDPFSGTLVTTLGASSTYYQDTGLDSSTVYVYGIKAYDYRNNVSTNTDVVVTSTLYSSTGSFYVYPTLREAASNFGAGVAIANVYGPQSGYPDLIVGATSGSEAGSVNQYTGCIHIFEGLSDGQFSLTPSASKCDPSPPSNGSLGSNNFGSSITKGDFNGDGLMDIAVSAPRDNSGNNFGHVYLYYTEAVGGQVQLTSSPAVLTRSLPVGNDGFGQGLCSGNLDGVGADDLVVVSSTEQCASNECGRLLVYKIGGPPYSVPSSPSYTFNPWSQAGAGNDLNDLGFVGNNNENMGQSCAIGRFDSTAPTQQQIVVGSGTLDAGGSNNNEGGVYFVRLLNTNLSSDGDFQVVQALINGVAQSTSTFAAGSYFGYSLSPFRTLGELDRLLVGVLYDSSVGIQSGAVYSYSVSMNTGKFDLIPFAETYLGNADLDRNGTGSGIGIFDWDNDGADDLLAVGSMYDDGTTVPGATNLDIGDVFTFFRQPGADTFSSAVIQNQFDFNENDVRTNQHFGSCMTSGDFNADGYTDIVIGADGQQYDQNNLVTNVWRGVVYLYYGKEAGEIDFQNPDQLIFGPNIANTNFGRSCAAVDFNADGVQDLVVGAPYRDNTYTDRGSVYVFYGLSGSYLPTSSSLTIHPPTGEGATSLYFGSALASSDWDGDGFADLAIGATGKNPGGVAKNGRVYVYFADITTHEIRTTEAPLKIDPPVNQANMIFGSAMLGFSTQLGTSVDTKDLIVCAPGRTATAHLFGTNIPSGNVGNFGNCWIYENGGGLAYTISGNTVLDNTPEGEIRFPYNLVLSVPGNIHFGASATSGDWDNDGIDDAVICASRLSAQSGPYNGTANAGVCFAYRGVSGGGFSSYSNYSGTDVPNGTWQFSNESPEASTVSYFGGGGWITPGGDVLLEDINNNGRDDLMVSEMYSDNLNPFHSSVGVDSGRVYVNRGSFASQP